MSPTPSVSMSIRTTACNLYLATEISAFTWRHSLSRESSNSHCGQPFEGVMGPLEGTRGLFLKCAPSSYGVTTGAAERKVYSPEKEFTTLRNGSDKVASVPGEILNGVKGNCLRVLDRQIRASGPGQKFQDASVDRHY